MGISYVATYTNYYEIPAFENEIDENLLKLLERLFQENLEDIKKGKSLSISRKEDSYIASVDEDLNKEHEKIFITNIDVIGSTRLKRDIDKSNAEKVAKIVSQKLKNSIKQCAIRHSGVIGIETKILDRFVRVELFCESVYFESTVQMEDDSVCVSSSTLEFEDLSYQATSNTNEGFL